MTDSDKPENRWIRVAEEVYPRRSRELIDWIEQQPSNWLTALAQRRLQGARDAPLAGEDVLNEVFLDLLDRLHVGILITDGELSDHFHNQIFENLLRSVEEITLDDGSLRIRSNMLSEGFRNRIEYLHEASPHAHESDPQAPSAAWRLQGDPDLLLYFAPAFNLPGLSAGGPLACVYVATEEAVIPISAQNLAHWYGLTRAEAELATAFADGTSLQEYAELRDISLNTVRNQFAAIKQKLGARNQVDVVRRLLLGNPLSVFSGPS